MYNSYKKAEKSLFDFSNKFMKTHKKYYICSACGITISPINLAGTEEIPLCRNCRDTQELEKSGIPEDERKKLYIFEAPDQILPNLWLGSCFSDLSLTYLRKKGISAIVQVCSEGNLRWPDDIEYYRIFVEDTIKTDLMVHFNGAINFIESHLKKNEGVLVRCAAGVSRSASIVTAYLMKINNWDSDCALSHLKEIRPIVNPNPGFIKQLKLFERELEN